MGILDRIKKRQIEGFKEFVINMETSGGISRQQIFLSGVLEDPVFMTYVMKNLRTFEDFMDLPSDEISSLLNYHEQVLRVMAKCLFGLPKEKLIALESAIPNFVSKLKDEFSYLTDVSQSEQQIARYSILKLVRKLQTQDLIIGFKWIIPPQDLFYPKTMKDGRIEVHFESGVLAALGEIVKGRRCGSWKHYYDTGKILAEGEYKAGLKVETWVFYYSNGSVRSQGKYLADLKQGIWQEWDRQGKETKNEYLGGVKKEA